MDTTSQERENRWRLEQVVHVCEVPLQQLALKALHASKLSKSAMDALAKSLPAYQRGLLTSTTATGKAKTDSWDISLCNAVLKQLNALANKKNSTAVFAIVDARNHCAHAVGGRVTSAMFEQHMDACTKAFTTLKGDVDAWKRLRTCEVDTSEVNILACSREATKEAESDKREGNRLFQENNFRGAREWYTKGLQIAGAVDPMVLAQLHNNRATANFRLQQYPPAKEDAKRAAELAPQWAKPHLRLAEIYYQMYKHHKAVARLEIALGLATAAQDTALVNDVTAKMADYRLQRDQATRCESENLAYGPMHETQAAFRAAGQARQGLNESQDPMAFFDKLTSLNWDGTGMESKKHVMLGQRATHDGRLADAARQFMAAAVAGDPEGMYNYAVCQLNGRGTRKNIPSAVQWLEKAATMPTTDSLEDKFKSVGVGEAMASLGNLYDRSIHFPQDKSKAREYWERSAELGVSSGLNSFALCLMNGSNGVKKDLPRARDLFRRSAELLHNEAMSNLGVVHGSLLEFETAARWADSAFKFGFLPAESIAARYRNRAAQLASLPPAGREMLASSTAVMPKAKQQPEVSRQNETPTLEELRKIGSPYGNRLFAAKQLIAEAMQGLYPPLDRDKVFHAVDLAVQAHRIDDSELVFSQEELRCSDGLASGLRKMGMPLDANLAVLSQVRDASSTTAFWKSMHLQFPEDLFITKRVACMLMFNAYAGYDPQRGVELFQSAFSLLPHPNDDSDPSTLDLLYLAGVAYFQTEDFKRAESLLTRFLKFAPADGHRKGAEAHYILGMIAMKEIPTRRPSHRSPKLDLSEVAEHLRQGDLLLQRIPAFLRGGAEESPNRKLIAGLVSIAGNGGASPPASPSAPRGRRRGGELLDSGPRRHAELQSDSPMFQPKWRKEIAAMANMARGASKTSSSWSTTPSRQSTRANHSSARTCTEATIDELFSALEDRVYTGRVLKCIVVSLPSFSGSSFHFVVEDSQREPARVAVYKAPQSLIAQLLPGRVFHLINPYVRMAQDGSIMLRVDDSSATIEVTETFHVICWVCSVEQAAAHEKQLQRCAKCHKATYCSKKCQTHDWSVDGHRFLCKVVSQTSS